MIDLEPTYAEVDLPRRMGEREERENGNGRKCRPTIPSLRSIYIC